MRQVCDIFLVRADLIWRIALIMYRSKICKGLWCPVGMWAYSPELQCFHSIWKWYSSACEVDTREQRESTQAYNRNHDIKIKPELRNYNCTNNPKRVHSCYFYSTSSSPLPDRGAPDTARKLFRNFTLKGHRQLLVNDSLKVPTWWLERDLNPWPFGR